jgi:hypothetical protein
MYRKGDGDEIKEKKNEKKNWKRGTKEAKKA